MEREKSNLLDVGAQHNFDLLGVGLASLEITTL